jgi:FkbM family methyltransferase
LCSHTKGRDQRKIVVAAQRCQTFILIVMHPVLWRARRLFAQTIQIGRYRIGFPRGSIIPETMSCYPLYGEAFSRIADALLSRYPDLHVIDIGANAGDTAALIRQSADIPVLCIEGDEAILPLLRKNVAQMPGVVIEPSFVGEEGRKVDLTRITAPGVNASISDAVSPAGTVPLRSLEHIAAEHLGFSRSKLLKVDAEGLDFEIILQSESLIRAARPVVFFEYNPFHYGRGIDPNSDTFGPSVLKRLAEWGYAEFLYFDNFGHFMMRVSGTDEHLVHQLHRYLESNRTNGRPAIYCYDICAFHAEDADMCEGFIAFWDASSGTRASVAAQEQI